ncbi:unnamed protein product, partial [Mesorhabditis spiculigera]
MFIFFGVQTHETCSMSCATRTLILLLHLVIWGSAILALTCLFALRAEDRAKVRAAFYDVISRSVNQWCKYGLKVGMVIATLISIDCLMKYRDGYYHTKQ